MLSNSVYDQPWWLDAVAPGQWMTAHVWKGGQDVARLAYHFREYRGLFLVKLPPLTPTTGPALCLPEGKYSTRLAAEHALLDELIASLPPSDLVDWTLPPGSSNGLPYAWRGFQLFTRYTYRLPDTSDVDLLWSNLTESCRRAIRKAQKQVAVVEDEKPDRVIEIARRSWARQGRRPPFEGSTIERIVDGGCERGAVRLLVAEDVKGLVHAGALIVADGRTVYYAVGGSDTELRSSGAHSLVLWEAVRGAAASGKAFDFEGSSRTNIERFFRSFGAQQVSLVHVRYQSRRLRMASAGKEIADAALGRRLRWVF